MCFKWVKYEGDFGQEKIFDFVLRFENIALYLQLKRYKSQKEHSQKDLNESTQNLYKRNGP